MKIMEEEATHKDHLSIQIAKDEEDDLTTSIKSQMDTFPQSYSICRVSDQLLKGNEHRYRPSLVSIGPLHRGSNATSPADQHKWRYFNTLITRKPNTEAVLDRCINALRRHESKVRNFYCKTTIQMGSNQFVEMLLIDGCFIIELFLENKHAFLRRRDDPLFATDNNISMLMHDLILLENQIPFFVIEHLFHLIQTPKRGNNSLAELTLSYFRELIPSSNRRGFCPEIHHLLDLIRLHYLPTHPFMETPVTMTDLSQMYILQATKLHTVGVKLEKEEYMKSPLDITFSNGSLRVPSLKFHDHTETLLGNLIAMEHCHPECPKIVTSYAILMEQLVKFKKDAVFLDGREILEGVYGRETEVVITFKKLRVESNEGKEFYYRSVCKEMSEYKASKRRVRCEGLRHIYHKTHLGIAGFSLAMLILVFIFTGLLFSVLTYLLHHFQ